MMDLTHAKLKQFAIHFVGNRTNDQELILSEETEHPDEIIEEKLHKYFLKKFPYTYEKYRFHNTLGLRFHELYHLVGDMFEQAEPFQEVSKLVAQHLYDNATHPNIKPGELYVCYYENCFLDQSENAVDAIGIFKTESKHDFLQVNRSGQSFQVAHQIGIDINKLDKGCLIFNTNQEEGYLVGIVDNQNKGEEAVYWKDDFLGLEPVANEFRQTNQFMGLAKSFVTKQLDEEYEVNKADKIDLLNKSLDYFKNKETFIKEEFEAEVFQNDDIIESFRNFEKNYHEENQISVADAFDISPQAVKKQTKAFKSVLKLDNNFHIYIHGNRELLEQGVDEDGRKYYKLYYKDEN